MTVTEEAFVAEARAFLDAHAAPRADRPFVWGEGPDTLAFFEEAGADEELRRVEATKRWQATQFDAGFGWIDGPPEYGGRGLPAAYDRRYRELRAEYDTPSLMGVYRTAPYLHDGRAKTLRDVLTTANQAGALGYQSGWTDRATGRVDMAARWYNPAVGQFMNKDTQAQNPVPNSAEANPFAYVDDIIDALVRKPACAQFIGSKLWRFFVEDEPSSALVDSVAATIRNHNFEMRPVLREIFTSAEFYSDRVMGNQIKGPVEYIVQTSKLLAAAPPAPIAAQNAMRQMGQILFAPPNVKGWDGGKEWISTSTLLFRYNFANYLINGDAILPPNVRQPRQGADVGFGPAAQIAQQIRRDPIDVAKLVPSEVRNKPREIVDLLAKRFFPTRPSDKEIDTFARFLESRGPDTSDATLRELVHLMMSTPKFQLV